MDDPFTFSDVSNSHSVRFKTDRHYFETCSEPGGQLILCETGEIELYGPSGEWIIPPDYMVFVPHGRMFSIRVRMPTSGLVIKFCRREVTWSHSGCWVGPVHEIAAHLTNYSLKWSEEEVRKRQKARAFFVTLGEMIPNWFQHERIMWTPYAQNSSVQKVIDFAKHNGPGISLSEVASHVGMSERNLRRHMQAELGQSWREFIRELRMNRAMELLRREQKSITETAFEVGFTSSSAFSSAFLDYVGKTPSAFLKNIKKQMAGSKRH